MGDDFFDVVFRKRLDVRGGKLLKEKFVTHAACGFAGATFLGAEHGEVDLRTLQKLGDRAGDFHRAAVVCGGAADPIEHVEVGVVRNGGHVEAVGPLEAILRRESPRIAGALHFLQGRRGRTAQFAFANKMAAQVGDVIGGPDTERADVVARVAGGAGPQCFRADGFAVQRSRRGALHVRAQILHEVARRKWFARFVRRAQILAAPARYARVQSQQISLRKLFQPSHTHFTGFLHLLHRNGLHLPERLWRGGEAEHSGNRMSQTAKRQCRDKSKCHHRVKPPQAKMNRVHIRFSHARRHKYF